MMIPARVIKLNEPHVAFCHAPSEQTIGGKRSGVFGFITIKFKCAIRFLGKIHDLRHAGLHTVSHFILRDTLVDSPITQIPSLQLMKLGHAVKKLSAAGAGYTIRVFQKENGILAAAKLDALMNAG